MTHEPCHPAATAPCSSLADAVVHLRRPFTPEVVRAKLQSQGADWGEAVFYVDARAVIDRLNLLLPALWRADFDLVDHSAAPVEGADPAFVYRCRLTVAEAAYTDVGEGFDHKAARSDALKRAAVHLGIGHCLYRIAPIRMPAGLRRHQLRGQPGFHELDAANHRWLRGRYRAWLTRMGIPEYGLPLHHGHVARSLAPELFPPPVSGARPRARRSSAAAERRPSLPPIPPVTSDEGIVGKGRPGAPTPSAETTRPPQPPVTAASSPPALAQPDHDPPAATVSHTTRAHGSPTPTAAAIAAPPPQPVALLELARRLGYSEPTVAALARCVHGRPLAELGDGALQDLRAFLDSAAGGLVDDAELAARLQQGLAEAQTEPPRERLARWLLAREERAAAA